MKTGNQERPQPNFWFIYTSFIGGLASLIWPEPGDYFGQSLIAYLLAVASAGGVLKGISSLRLDHYRRRKVTGARHSSHALGAARYASVSELLRGNLLDPAGSILLGILSGLSVWLPPGLMLALQSPPGGGKTSAIIIGAVFHALMTGRSVVCGDVKPEIVFVWRERLEKMGFRVFVNNPGLIPGLPHNGDSNPYAPLVEIMADRARHGEAFIFAENLARVQIKDVKDDKNSFFKENDRTFLIVVSVALATFYPTRCYPSQIWRTLTDPRALKDLLYECVKSDVLEGDLAAMAASLLEKERDNPEHFENGRSGASQSLSVFKPSSTLGSVGASHDFDPAELRRLDVPPAIVFDISRSDQMQVFGNVNALQQTARLQTLKHHREGREILLLCDEATNSPVPTVVSEIELMRSYGLTLVLSYQSYPSLERVYGKDQAASIRASSVEMYFGVGDFATADEISRRIGDTTIKTNSFSFNEDGKPSQTVGESAKRLLPADEILSMPKDQALVLVPGMKPIRLKKTPWFEVDPYKILAGENPHERHKPSERTLLSLRYGRDATEIRPPYIRGFKKNLDGALKRERKASKPASTPLVKARSFLWIPVVSACWALVYMAGLPHVIFEYSPRPDFAGNSRCIYFGFGGFREVSVKGSCPTVTLLRSDEEISL